jgi:hypothetical protein
MDLPKNYVPFVRHTDASFEHSPVQNYRSSIDMGDGAGIPSGSHILMIGSLSTGNP